MDLGITGRRALICGASSGLGLACAQALAAEGVQVTLASRSEHKLQAAAKQIEAATGVAAQWIAADLSQAAGSRQTGCSWSVLGHRYFGDQRGWALVYAFYSTGGLSLASRSGAKLPCCSRVNSGCIARHGEP